MSAKLDTTPTQRTYKGQTILFYSPQQIETIIPPHNRLPEQRGSNTDEHSVGLGYKKGALIGK